MNLYTKIQAGRELYDERVKVGRWLPRRSGDLMMMYDNSQPFKPQGTQTQSVETLNNLRNEFIHFLPKGWSLEVGGLPQMVWDCGEIIDFLAFQCGNVLWHDETLKSETRDLTNEVRQQLKTIIEVHE